ncbi:hypothetical protein Nos7524_3189 [Nostoc sp. PCC 7524]|nr:hypothetical protein Nos7524_3189 [Nostoc sp. PCC 7524]
MSIINKGRLRGAEHPRSKEYICIDPEGNEYRIRGLSEFCRQYNLNSKRMNAIAVGKGNFHKGWQCMFPF